jgi:hypothetical protein
MFFDLSRDRKLTFYEVGRILISPVASAQPGRTHAGKEEEEGSQEEEGREEDQEATIALASFGFERGGQ